MDINKAPGFDGITVGCLKCFSAVVAPFLCDLFNLCLFNGKYPDELKVAMVVPVYKEDSAEEVRNRPISVLPPVNKVLERQYGFRNGSGTQTALFELTGMMNKAIDDKEIVSWPVQSF